MQTNIAGLRVTGIAAALPQNRLDLLSLSTQFGEAEVRRIIAGTGIHAIRVARHKQRASDLCAAAAIQLFSSLNISPDSIDGIIFVSQTSDAALPATSVILQDRLSLPTTSVAFDINYGCSGYIYGLYQAAMLLIAGGCSRVLLCVGDVITPILDPEDRAVRMVFGDAGSATLIEKGEDTFSFILRSDGSGAESLHAGWHPTDYNGIVNKSNYLSMDGSAIMEFALREVPLCVQETLNLQGWDKSSLDVCILHQANQFMLNYLRKKMDIPKELVPIALSEIGNTGSASIPLTLSLKHEELRSKSTLNRSILCGFGVGLSWGAVGLNLSKTSLIPVIDVV